MRVEAFRTRVLRTNTYVVGPETGRDVAVIDPGAPGPVLEYVRRENLRVVAIINTHAHLDHIWGNHPLAAATGAPVMIHADDAAKATRAHPLAWAVRGRRAWSPAPARLLADGDAVSVGTIDLEVIHTPGHSPGGICLKYKKTLFTGDSLLAGAIGNTDTPEDWKRLSTAIQDRLFVLSDDIAVWPGHGPRTTIERERKLNIFVRHSPDVIERWLLDSLRGPRKRKDAEAS